MLRLPSQPSLVRAQQLMHSYKGEFASALHNTRLTTDKIKYFTHKNKYSESRNVSVIYLDIKKDSEQQKVSKLLHLYIQALLKEQIIAEDSLREMYIEFDKYKGMYVSRDPHITLFRCEGLPENQQFLDCYQRIESLFVGFQLECDYVDVSTRWSYDHTKFYTPLYRIVLN
jgi:hypothetical protein